MVESAKATAKSIPFRKKQAKGLLDPNGKPWVKYVPHDMERRYDEAMFQVYDTRLRRGYMIPKLGANGQLECIPTPVIGLALGFAMGLQYDWRKQGQCYTNIESIFIQLDTIW